MRVLLFFLLCLLVIQTNCSEAGEIRHFLTLSNTVCEVSGGRIQFHQTGKRQTYELALST